MRVIVSLLAAVALSSFVLGCGGDDPAQEAQPERVTTAEQRAQVEEQPEQQDQAEPRQQSKPAVAQQQSDPEEQDEEQAEAGPEAEQEEPADATEQAQQQDAQSSGSVDDAEDDSSAQEEEDVLILGGERPARLFMPDGADPAEPRPLILLLHGYGSRGSEADAYFQFSAWVDKGGFALLLPDGTMNEAGARFWSATPECCDFFHPPTDDVAYLSALVAEARGVASFDRVYAVGHSNGGFMAYRLACEDVPGLTAIVSLAGGAFADPDLCANPKPLSVLQIHGDRDLDVLYEGGQLPAVPDPDRGAVPGAEESVQRWAERAGCDLKSVQRLRPIDTDTNVDGSETRIRRISDDCAEGTVFELWTIHGGGHIPFVWGTDFTPRILSWLDDRYSGEPPADPVARLSIDDEREAVLALPAARGDGPLPLVVSLHGYGGDAEIHDWYFGLSERVSEYGFALLTPQGTVDERGNRFWNATDACCNFYGSGVDDYAWISSLVAEAAEIVELSGVFLVGYSNGGFMSYRMACDGLDGLVAIVSLAGSSFGDPARCDEATPVSVLQIHGTADADIPYKGTLEYDGGNPGAVELTQRWGERAGCDLDQVEALASIDLDSSLDGAETKVERLREGCDDGITIELWTIEGGSHGPSFNDDWPDHLLRWMFFDSRTN